ncbi:zinc finger protein [Striga asiatica]|uniref:Zinc finger protein n=1 Tax=Striga asiatica TaxID=4170 RepID=A0A5A7R9B1_STRAF|nr:zinc finger protein [Striga asiatica]
MMSGDLSSSFPNPQAPKILPHQVLETNPNSKPNPNPNPNLNPNKNKKRRNLPGTPDPDAEVVSLSPRTLMATNRFVCEICNKGFQRDQNLQLHRRGHNLPWKLKQRANKDIVKKKVYVCPEKTCIHHDPSRALGDLTGIKKHFSRKHGEKKWKCDKCSKKYAVRSDWKAHSKTCGSREYKCDCGTLFSRKDSFITHRAFCDALADESARLAMANGLNFGNHDLVINNNSSINNNNNSNSNNNNLIGGFIGGFPLWLNHQTNHHLNPNIDQSPDLFTAHDMNIQMDGPNNHLGPAQSIGTFSNLSLTPMQAMKEEPTLAAGLYSSENGKNHNHQPQSPVTMSATALLQKAAQMGSIKSGPGFVGNMVGLASSTSSSAGSELNRVFGPSVDGFFGGAIGRAPGVQVGLGLTRDFLGVGGRGVAGGPLSPQELARSGKFLKPPLVLEVVDLTTLHARLPSVSTRSSVKRRSGGRSNILVVVASTWYRSTFTLFDQPSLSDLFLSLLLEYDVNDTSII